MTHVMLTVNTIHRRMEVRATMGTRREFIKEAAVAGMTIGAGSACVAASDSGLPIVDEQDGSEPCPFFDQPLQCDGPRDDGTYPCDSR